MHDHIEEMGKNIVRRVNPNKPEMHSRLWIAKEIVDVLANGSATQATQCITLDADVDSDAEEFNFGILMKGLANMKELRFLQLNSPCFINVEVSKWKFDEDSLHLPNALRFLKWDHYPFSSLPKTFQPNNLVGLQMNGGKMVQLWKDGEEKPFLKLRFLKLASLFDLRTLDLNVAPNLETLFLQDCHALVEVHFQVTPNLKELCIFHCYKLEKLHMPAECDLEKLRTLDLSVAPNLETLILYQCDNLVEVHFQVTPNLKELVIYGCNILEKLHMPAKSPKLRSLDLYDSQLRTLHLGVTPNLETLRVKDCHDLVELQIPAECPKLVNLDLSDCFQVVKLPEEIGRLECLKELDITGTCISHLPESIFRVKGLRIVGDRELLESCGFTSEIKTSDGKTFCYI